MGPLTVKDYLSFLSCSPEVKRISRKSSPWLKRHKNPNLGRKILPTEPRIWWASGYNILAIPLAAEVIYNFGIVLSQAVGAILMSLSTVIVAINARLLKIRIRGNAKTRWNNILHRVFVYIEAITCILLTSHFHF